MVIKIMRPIRRDTQPADYMNPSEYREFCTPLLQRLGSYCAYCERYISNYSAAHIEHIQPKSLYLHLEKEWTNLLIACDDCNNPKGKQDIDLTQNFLPDRDNTFLAFDYSYGQIGVSAYAQQQQGLQQIAQNTLDLFQFNNTPVSKKVNLDITMLRIEMWNAITEYEAEYNNQQITLGCIIRSATKFGFFSIWMKVFENYPEVRNALIDAFPSTHESGCFDANGQPVSPCPNPDNLPHGGKI